MRLKKKKNSSFLKGRIYFFFIILRKSFRIQIKKITDDDYIYAPAEHIQISCFVNIYLLYLWYDYYTKITSRYVEHYNQHSMKQNKIFIKISILFKKPKNLTVKSKHELIHSFFCMKINVHIIISTSLFMKIFYYFCFYSH